MKLPTIIVNFKTYQKANGEKGIELARKCKEAQEETDKDVSIVISPPIYDLKQISRKVDIPVYAQHVDPVNFGSNTGSIPVKPISDHILGSIISHSEKRLSIDQVEERIKWLKQEGKESLVCVNNPLLAKRVSQFKPDYIAFEPPELIGGDKSVSETEPQVIKEVTEKVKETDSQIEVLTGAGIKTKKDVEKAIEMGTKGILIASGVIKTDDTKEEIHELISAF